MSRWGTTQRRRAGSTSAGAPPGSEARDQVERDFKAWVEGQLEGLDVPPDDQGEPA